MLYKGSNIQDICKCLLIWFYKQELRLSYIAISNGKFNTNINGIIQGFKYAKLQMYIMLVCEYPKVTGNV